MRESVLTNYLKTSSDGCPVTHYQPSCRDVVAMTMTLWPMRAMKKQKSLNVVQSHGLLPAKTSPPMTSWWCHAREKLGRTSTQKMYEQRQQHVWNRLPEEKHTFSLRGPGILALLVAQHHNMSLSLCCQLAPDKDSIINQQTLCKSKRKVCQPDDPETVGGGIPNKNHWQPQGGAMGPWPQLWVQVLMFWPKPQELIMHNTNGQGFQPFFSI